MDANVAVVVAAVIAGVFGLLAAYLQHRLREGKKQLDGSRRALATVTPPGSPDLVVEHHSYSFDMKSDGSCSLLRRVVLRYEGTGQLATKKILLHHEGIDFYVAAKGVSLDRLNPDKEFDIQVIDEHSRVRQDSWTYIEGERRQFFETTVRFDNPLTPEHSTVGLSITYNNLHVSFFWKKLWEEQHRDEWFEVVRERIEQYEMSILFPKDLPKWFRKARLGLSLIPLGWGSVTEDSVDSRRRVTLQANDIEPNKYRMRIDAG